MRPGHATDAACLRHTEPRASRPRTLDPAPAAVGTLLCASRLRHGIRQFELAQTLGVSTRTVQAWEAGRERIPPERVEAVARAVKLPAEDLEASAHIARTPDERAALAAYRTRAEGKVMMFEPPTPDSMRDLKDALARTGIAPRPGAAPAPLRPVPAAPPAPATHVLPPGIRLVALLVAVASLLVASLFVPAVVALLLAPCALVLGIETAAALYRAAQDRAERAAAAE